MKKIITITTIMIFLILPNQNLTAQNKKKKKIKTVQQFLTHFVKAFQKNNEEKIKNKGR